MSSTRQPRLSDQHVDAEISRYLARRAAALRVLATTDDSIRELTARLSDTATADRGKGRPKTMLNATRVAAAIAILTLGAGLVLARVGLQPDSGPVAPGAEATFTVPGEWAFFSGEMRYDGRMPVGAAQPEEYVENGLTIFTQQAGFEGQTFTASDPRLTGARSELETTILEDADAGASIWAERSVIENDDGAWTCVLTSLSRPESEAAGPVPLSGWCDGSEAYDGLHAYLAIHHDDPLPGGALLVTGFVSDVDGPLVPASE